MPLQKRLDPQPPELKAPWRTGARVELQMAARAFARDIVLPVVDELDPQKAEMPKSLIDQMAARAGSALRFPLSMAVWGLVFRILPCLRRTCAWLALGRQHPSAGPGTWHANDRRSAQALVAAPLGPGQMDRCDCAIRANRWLRLCSSEFGSEVNFTLDKSNRPSGVQATTSSIDLKASSSASIVTHL